MKVIVKGQSSETHEINASLPQGSLLGHIHFFFYIKDLPKNILRTLVNIYVDDTKVDGCTSKNGEAQLIFPLTFLPPLNEGGTSL